MPSGVFTITDIPDNKVETVIADFEMDSPPPKIQKIPQSPGLWTVKATYPVPGPATTKKHEG